MLFFSTDAHAHGGGLDANGGHNCYVGSCAGTYHVHRPAKSSPSANEDLAAVIVLSLLAIGMIYPFVKNIPKVLMPSLQTEAEKRYWDADEMREQARKKQEEAIKASAFAATELDAGRISHDEYMASQAAVAAASEAAYLAEEAYQKALRIVHAEEERTRREKRLKRYKK